MQLKIIRRVKKKLQYNRGAKQVRQTGFWFVDIPRTSSSSIKAELGHRFGPAHGKSEKNMGEYASQQLFNDHIPAEMMRNIVGHATWNNLYTFTFVRNPFDRLLSLYHYQRKYGTLPDTWSFSDYVERLAEADHKTPHFRFHAFRYGSSKYVLDKNGKLLVDDVLRFEDRENGIKVISQKIGFPELGQLHVMNASPKIHSYREMYTDATRELAAEHYAVDLALFDYSF